MAKSKKPKFQFGDMVTVAEPGFYENAGGRVIAWNPNYDEFLVLLSFAGVQITFKAKDLRLF